MKMVEEEITLTRKQIRKSCGVDPSAFLKPDPKHKNRFEEWGVCINNLIHKTIEDKKEEKAKRLRALTGEVVPSTEEEVEEHKDREYRIHKENLYSELKKYAEPPYYDLGLKEVERLWGKPTIERKKEPSPEKIERIFWTLITPNQDTLSLDHTYLLRKIEMPEEKKV